MTGLISWILSNNKYDWITSRLSLYTLESMQMTLGIPKNVFKTLS